MWRKNYEEKWFWLVLPAVLLLVILLGICSNSKAGLIARTLRNLDEMETYAKNCMQEPESYVNYNGWNTRYSPLEEMVTFQIRYLGFGSQADEKGICYVPDGQPRKLGCELGQELRDKGILFLGDGDNSVYMEQIAEKWFWFEQHW